MACPLGSSLQDSEPLCSQSTVLSSEHRSSWVGTAHLLAALFPWGAAPPVRGLGLRVQEVLHNGCGMNE